MLSKDGMIVLDVAFIMSKFRIKHRFRLKIGSRTNIAKRLEHVDRHFQDQGNQHLVQPTEHYGHHDVHNNVHHFRDLRNQHIVQATELHVHHFRT